MKLRNEKMARFFIDRPRALAAAVHCTGEYWCPYPVGDERKRVFDAEYAALSLEQEIYESTASAGGM